MLEDDKDLSQLVTAYLSLEFMVDCVEDIDEAAAYIERYDYDVVLLDRNIHGYGSNNIWNTTTNSTRR